jgi:hypothetical protein
MYMHSIYIHSSTAIGQQYTSTSRRQHQRAGMSTTRLLGGGRRAEQGSEQAAVLIDEHTLASSSTTRGQTMAASCNYGNVNGKPIYRFVFKSQSRGQVLHSYNAFATLALAKSALKAGSLYQISSLF